MHKGGYKDSNSVNLEFYNSDKINLNNAGLDTLMGFVEALLKMPPLKVPCVTRNRRPRTVPCAFVRASCAPHDAPSDSHRPSTTLHSAPL